MVTSYNEACHSFTKPVQWLQYYAQFYTFWVQYQNNGFCSKWRPYSLTEKPDFEPNQRQILPTEIVFDIDYPNAKAAVICEELAQRLDRADYTYAAFNSGGKGIHIHSFIPMLRTMDDERRTETKKNIIRFFGDGLAGIDMTAAGPKRLIALESSLHRKTGNIKRLLFHKFNGAGINHIPKQCLVTKTERVIYGEDQIDYDMTPDMKPECIKFFESDAFFRIGDGTRRASFIMASFYHHHYRDNKIVDRKLREWVSKCKDKSVSESDIHYLVHKKHERYVSCRYRNEVMESIGVACRCRMKRGGSPSH